jgi:hypothetical protein
MTHRLADFYGFKTGEPLTDDQRKVTVMRIDGADELDWLLTLGAVVRTLGWRIPAQERRSALSVPFKTITLLARDLGERPFRVVSSNCY